MDIELPGSMNGIEAAKRIRAAHGTPVIFLTAYSEPSLIEQAKSAEPFGYILKPFKERELLTTIDIALYKSMMDRKLRRQEQLFSAILHSVNEGIVATDTDFHVSFMNPVAEELCGWSEEAARGRAAAEIVPVIDPESRRPLLPDTAPILNERPLLFTEAHIRSQNGRIVLVDGSVTRIREEANASEGFVITLRDITEMKRMSETISYQASHDILTGLANRDEFSFRLNAVLQEVRGSTSTHALLVLDIDRFKAVNDTLGGLAGDELLRQCAGHIQANVSRHDASARIGGDEFAIILMDCDMENSRSVALRLQEAVQTRKFVWQSGVFPVTLSIGIVPITKESGDLQTIIAAANDACNISKEEGGNRITNLSVRDAVFQKHRGEMDWISKLNRAVEENRFVLYQQLIAPIDSSRNLEIKHELLLRLVNEDGSIASPGEFIPAAERYSLMPLIDRWVVRSAFEGYRELVRRKSPLAGRIFCINLSGPSILDEGLSEYILDETKRLGLDRSRFNFEITETAAIQNLVSASRFMSRLKDEGFTFSLDDFGSGFSSFGYLKNLPVDYLKIDGSLVQGIEDSDIQYTMVKSINMVGQVMGIRTIAEFVKNEAILGKLVEIGVDYAQGYQLARPEPLL
ncbi:MAG TPA: EAL domain-containing protein, partial [Rectinemataceae bacterium]|nr:EAL domain-containing protein [Rectinemataceae bacterium]